MRYLHCSRMWISDAKGAFFAFVVVVHKCMCGSVFAHWAQLCTDCSGLTVKTLFHI